MNLVRPFWIIPALLAAAPSIADAPAPAPWLSQPALSPDGREITFSSGGDLWSVPASGGEARLLVSHAADDRRPIYSPDGKRIAFVSDRTGNGDLYVLTLANGALARLTYDDGVENPDGWSADGAWIYFSSNTADISGMQDVYRVRAGGGTPMAVSAERYTNEFAAAPSPDGHSLLMSVGGIANAQWWRRGHSHIDESEIWLRSEGDRVGFRRLIGGGAKALWPMWAPDGRHFYFMSDRSGSENLWSGDMSGAATPLTHFDSGRLLWPSIAADGRTIVFERDFGLWTLDTATGTAHPVVITLHGAPAGAGNEFRKLSGDAGSIALSPDGKKIALVVHGEVFAISAADGGEATRVTRTPAAESDVAWAPDSRRIVYVSTREGASHVYLYDFTKSAEARLTTGDGIDVDPEFSPDGRQIAFLRDGRELRVMDPDGVKQRLLASGVIDLTPPLDSTRPFTWSPDSKWIAYLSQGARLFRNASVVSVEGASPQPIPVSFLANLSSNTISWSPDASFLLFDTSQRTEPGQVARVDLVPHTPRFREQQFRDLFKEEKKPAAETPAKAPAKPAAAKKPDAPAHPVEIVRARTASSCC
jgi:tricorn protease